VNGIYQLTEQLGGGYAFGPPKSKAGKRVVPFPAMLKTELRWHLKCFVTEDDDALVFTSPTGAPMRHSNFYRRAWLPAVRKLARAALRKAQTPKPDDKPSGTKVARRRGHAS
jgi:hypothetical protein